MPAEILRLSASAVSKFHNCHASANLTKAIPGFELRPKARAKARDQGTAMHTVLERILLSSPDRLAAANVLMELAAVHNRGGKRDAIIASVESYITWLVLGLGITEPPMELEHIQELVFKLPDEDGNLQNESTPPKLIRFLAECIRYIDSIISLSPGSVLEVEAEAVAEWVSTKPTTRTDYIIRQGDVLWVIDLKGGTTPIPAFENEQLLYYARTFRKNESRLKLVIMQSGAFDLWEVDAKYLDKWSASVQDSVTAIVAGDVTFKPGSWCTMCPANPRGRGDGGYPACPVMLELYYGAEVSYNEDDVLKGIDDD